MLTLITFLFILVGTGRLFAENIQVRWDPAQVKRGSVVLLKVHSPLRLMAAEAATGGERFPLLKVEDGVYAALVGIDSRLEESVVPVDFSLFPERGGAPYRIQADLKVKHSPATPPRVQKLSLPTGMVDLSQKGAARVRKDNESLGGALDARSRQRFWKTGFILPVQGRITTRFGTGRVLNGKQRSPHSGVDIAAEKGRPIVASNSGLVQLTGELFLSGKTVVVDHGWGVSTIYAHLDQIKVREGQLLERGEVVGTVGRTGRATGPHLHFGAFIRGSRIDPLKLIEVTEEF